MSQDVDYIKQYYPLPAYNYCVSILNGNKPSVLGFSEVDGLVLEYEPVTYRDGLSFLRGETIVPGLRQPIHITLKRGVLVGKSSDSRYAEEGNKGNYLAAWLKKAHYALASKQTRDVVIDLCDENGASVISWKVIAALPIKLEMSTLDADSNDVAIETLELAAHGLSVNYAPSSSSNALSYHFSH